MVFSSLDGKGQIDCPEPLIRLILSLRVFAFFTFEPKKSSPFLLFRLLLSFTKVIWTGESCPRCFCVVGFASYYCRHHHHEQRRLDKIALADPIIRYVPQINHWQQQPGKNVLYFGRIFCSSLQPLTRDEESQEPAGHFESQHIFSYFMIKCLKTV